MTDLMKQVDDLLNAKPDITPILEQLKDKSIPLETRWTAYTKLVEANLLVSDRGYGDGFIGVFTDSDITLYDDFGMNRYATMTFPDMYERIMQADEDYYPELFKAQENIEDWQEAVLQSGYSSFTNDL